MNKEAITKPEIKLVGITVRTNNKNERDPATKRIFPNMQKYFQEQMHEQTKNRINQDSMYSAYYDYESDHTGDYTHFFGQEVSSFDDQPAHLEQLTIPAQSYVKYTPSPAPMPQVIFDTWQTVWDDKEVDSRRAYNVDFEIYDERSRDMDSATFDLFIGVK